MNAAAGSLPPLAATADETRALEALRTQWLVRPPDAAADSPLVALLARLGDHSISFRQPLPVDVAQALHALGPDERDRFSRLAIACTLQAAPARRLPVSLPESVAGFYRQERLRIVRRLQNTTGLAADLLHDSWRKELLIAAGALLPIGAGFVDVQAGVPRSYLLRGGFAQALRGLRAVLECGGFAPFAELHAHTESIAAFTPEGWQAAYRVLAELLSANPALRGVIRANWFIDPQIATISPRLAYTRDVPGRHGARYLFVALDRQGSSGALARSPTRRALFESGRYVPQIHMMIWPRRALLQAFAPPAARDADQAPTGRG
jgi:hypothetical protein